MLTLDHSAWRDLFARAPKTVIPLRAFLQTPAEGAVPKRIAQVLSLPPDCFADSQRGDSLLWSRQLLKHFRDIDQNTCLVDDERLRFASQSIATWQRLAAHLGARRLAQPLIRRVLRADLDAALAAVGPEALRFARATSMNDPLIRQDIDGWPDSQIAEALLPTGIACLQAALRALPPALAWRGQLRLPLAEPAQDTLLPSNETLWPACLALAKELNASWFS